MPKTLTDNDLLLKSVTYRQHILAVIKNAGAGHTGGDLSCIDILNVLYNRIMNVGPDNFGHPNRDRFIQSKGHCVEALYVVLADRGFFPFSDLESLCLYSSHYVGHPTRKINGIEQNTGALGHGLSVAVGMALAAKMDGRSHKVYCLLGDGEMAEGSNWEAILTAAHYALDNLVAIVDRNGLQITGPTSRVCNTHPLGPKFESFGWTVTEVDGHNLQQLGAALENAPFNDRKPAVVIANTVKGKGISFMEHEKKWHHGVPSDEQYQKAMQELETAKRDLLDRSLTGTAQ